MLFTRSCFLSMLVYGMFYKGLVISNLFHGDLFVIVNMVSSAIFCKTYKKVQKIVCTVKYYDDYLSGLVFGRQP